MFENLSDKLQRSFKTLRGQGTISDENVSDALREIRLALLESDVNLAVVTELIDHIRTRAIGEKVATALSPSEQIVKIVHDELINLLGKDTARFQKSSQPPSVILMAGLQGSGKTTTSGKLAQWLKKAGHRPMLVSVDVYRPAAREQLKVVATSIGAQLYEGKVTEEKPGTDAVLRLAKEAKREAANYGCDMLIVDTAGRNQIDAALMDEIDTLIIIGFDSQRTGQAAAEAEISAVRAFLARPDAMLFVCPHHDVGDTEGLAPDAARERQVAEFRHHGDIALPGQQRFGGFGLSLMAGLGAPIRNRFGLRPARADDGDPAPFNRVAEDRFRILTGVPHLNLHPHLPHYERIGAGADALEVLARQTVQPKVPAHPVVAPGGAFDAILQARPEAGLGRLVVCDATLWSSTAGGLRGLQVFWKNVIGD